MKSYTRFISRNKAYAAILFIGLSVALAFVVLLYSYVREGFPLHIEFPWLVIVLATVLTLLIAAVSVSIQTRRAALENPVEGLKEE